MTAADGPVDTTAAVSAGQFRECLELATADEEVSAVIVLVLPTGATGDLVAAIQQADIRVPLAVVLLDQAETVRLLPGSAKGDGEAGGIPIPAFSSPEAVAAAVARAARYGARGGRHCTRARRHQNRGRARTGARVPPVGRSPGLASA